MKIRIIRAFLTIMICAGAAVGQDDVLGQYESATIPQMTAKFGASKPSGDEVFVTESYMIKTRLAYSGASRKVSEKKSAFMAKWLKQFQYPAEMLPTTEYEFKAGSNKYWLVLQDIVAPHFIQEIKAGGEVDVYAVLLGALKEDGRSTFVILINEFKRPEDERPSGPRTGKPKVWGEEDTLQGYERYVVRTLREVIVSHSRSEATTGANVLLTGDTFPSKVRVTYTGSFRKVSPLRKQHLDMLAGSFNVDPKVIARYDTEMLFKEGDDEHWLPVLRELIPFFEKELTKGESVVLYTEWVGARKIDNKWEWIFLVQEFQKPSKSTITGARLN